jgi:hypothetical protein
MRNANPVTNIFLKNTLPKIIEARWGMASSARRKIPVEKYCLDGQP